MSGILEELSEKDKQECERLRYFTYQSKKWRDCRNKIKNKKKTNGLVEEEQIQFKIMLVTAGQKLCRRNIIQVKQPDIKDSHEEGGVWCNWLKARHQ